MKAAGDNDVIMNIDGMDNWERIVAKGSSNREEFVYNIDDVKDVAAFRYKQYKLVNNKPGSPGQYCSALFCCCWSSPLSALSSVCLSACLSVLSLIWLAVSLVFCEFASVPMFLWCVCP